MAKFSAILLTGLIAMTPVLFTKPALALFDESREAACQGVNLSDQGTCDPASGNRLTQVLRIGLQLLSILVGIIAVLMLIIGGLKYIMSQGDSSNITAARNTVLYAIVGLVIVMLAQFIVRFVLTKTTT